MQELKYVTKQEFLDFINNYPRKLSTGWYDGITKYVDNKIGDCFTGVVAKYKQKCFDGDEERFEISTK